MKQVSVSISKPIFDAAELLGAELKVSRSQLYAMAVARFLEEQSAMSVTEKLNAAYAVHSSKLDRSLERAQFEVLKREAW